MLPIRILVFLIAVSFSFTTFAQTSPVKPAPGADEAAVSFRQKDTAYWIYNFRHLRDALFQKDKAKARQFFNFPFKTEGNEIWYLAYDDNEKEIDHLSDAAKPFTEKDFNKYFDHIFPDAFLKCLLKIKTGELYKNGKTESPEFKDSATTFKLYAVYDKTGKTLSLNFATETLFKISETEYESAESNFIYVFDILNNGHIKFRKLMIAG